jgi:hypothetical protein
VLHVVVYKILSGILCSFEFTVSEKNKLKLLHLLSLIKNKCQVTLNQEQWMYTLITVNVLHAVIIISDYELQASNKSNYKSKSS